MDKDRCSGKIGILPLFAKADKGIYFCRVVFNVWNKYGKKEFNPAIDLSPMAGGLHCVIGSRGERSR